MIVLTQAPVHLEAVRCTGCAVLLFQRAGAMGILLGRHQDFHVTGVVALTCRRCKTENVIMLTG